MPKLSLDEIEIMLDDADELEESPKENIGVREVTHKLEVKRRLDNYFEHKHLKRSLGYEYLD